MLTSGRAGLGLWVLDVATLRWSTFLNLAAAHNSGLPPAAPADFRFDANETAVRRAASRVSWPTQTKAYTALTALPCDGATTCSVLVAYGREANGNGGPPGPWGLSDRVFTMRIDVS